MLSRVKQKKAISYHKRYLAIAREIGDRRGEGNALCNLGLAHATLGEDIKAIKCYIEAISQFKETGDRLGAIKAVVNIGDSFVRVGILGGDGGNIKEFMRNLAHVLLVGDDPFGHQMHIDSNNFQFNKAELTNESYGISNFIHSNIYDDWCADDNLVGIYSFDSYNISVAERFLSRSLEFLELMGDTSRAAKVRYDLGKLKKLRQIQAGSSSRKRAKTD